MKKAEVILRLEDIKNNLTKLAEKEDHEAWVNEGSSIAVYHSGKSAGLNKAIKLINEQLNEVK